MDFNSFDCLKLQAILKLSGSSNISIHKLIDDIKQIDKDLERTSFIIEMNHKYNDSPQHPDLININASLRNILITFVAFNQNLNEFKKENSSFNLGYTQG